jgi:predicted flavoprotein YhiN
MEDIEETTVLIIGAGPSGLALAALLGRMGVQVRYTPTPSLPPVRVLTTSGRW